MKAKSLETLENWCKTENLAVVAAGPSLDYCAEEIERLIKHKTLFLLSDVVAFRFIRRYPNSRRIVFSVENRYHNYLKLLKGEKLALYTGANPGNLKKNENDLYNFHFDFDGDRNDSFPMKSVGTVMGPAIYWALYLKKKTGSPENIFLLGIDLMYIDNQVYSRFAFNSIEYKTGYFQRREGFEYIATLMRSGFVQVVQGVAVRTSVEFKKARENLNIFLQMNASGLGIYDFSPLGASDLYVKKIIPEKIKSE